ncbi:DnaB-like helicase N-terminal domain-containing protein [Niallia sp. FSL R7-0271]|uniref:DnaB-like helicase N-terminal domain-containing protein n=1 Tax=Niallia sp. FSL R7-0271 TaxID=2921678 RepID=UPI004047A5A7
MSLTNERFSETCFQLIFQAMRTLEQLDTPPDLVAMAGVTSQGNSLERVSGLTFNLML